MMQNESVGDIEQDETQRGSTDSVTADAVSVIREDIREVQEQGSRT